MFIVEIPGGAVCRMVGPFASFLEAREHLSETLGDWHLGRVLEVYPVEPTQQPEPGL